MKTCNSTRQVTIRKHFYRIFLGLSGLCLTLIAAHILIGSSASRSVASSSEKQTWKEFQLPESAQGQCLRSVFFLDAKQGWIVGDQGLCLATGDGGETWTALETGSKATLRHVQFLDAKNGWICGDGDPDAPEAQGHVVSTRPQLSGTLLHTIDGGKNWKTFWIPTNFEITWIEASTAPVLQIGMSGGEDHLDGDIMRSLDGGKSWDGDRCFRALYAVRRVDGKHWTAVGSPVSVGFEPTPSPENCPENQYQMHAHHDCRSLNSDDGGKTWQVSEGSESRQHPYLGLELEDDEPRVKDVQGPAKYSGIEEDDLILKFGKDKIKSRKEFEDAVKKHKIGAKISLVVQRDNKELTFKIKLGGRIDPESGSLKALVIGKNQAVLAAGDRGAIYLSKNAGVNWQATSSPTTQNLKSIAWSGPIAVAVGENGTAILSKDDGKTWEKAPSGRAETLYGAAVAGDYIIVVGDKGVALRAKVSELAEQKKKASD